MLHKCGGWGTCNYSVAKVMINSSLGNEPNWLAVCKINTKSIHRLQSNLNS